MLSRYSREPLPSHMRTPAACSGAVDVEPEMNHRSSWTIEGRWTFLVVSSGRVQSFSEKRSCGGANKASVPVPVL